MRKLKAVLLAAAVTAGLPAMVAAQRPPRDDNPQQQDDPRGHRDDGDRQRPAANAPRPDQGPRPDPGNAQRQQADQARAQQQQQQVQRAQQQQAQPAHRGDFRPDQGRPDDRRPDGNRGPDGRPDVRGRPDARPDFRGDNRYNRAWRQDRRYDWRGYRDQNRQVFRAPRYIAPRGWGWGYRPFSVGVRIPPFFFGEQYWIDDPSYYRLPPAYGPYRWVRYYSDVLLIDLRSGIVVDEIPNFFF